MIDLVREGPEAGLSAPCPRIALGSWAFSFGPFESAPWGFERFCEFTAENGYDGVEINGFRPHPHDAYLDAADIRGLRSMISGLGLGISGYAPDLESTPPSEVATTDYLERIESIAKFCELLDIHTVRVDTVLPPPGPQGDRKVISHQQLVRTWQSTADLLASSDIELVWEVEPGFWLNRPSEVARLFSQVDRPNFGLLFDTSHATTIGAYGLRQCPAPEIFSSGAVGFADLVAGNVRHLHLIDSDGSLHNGETSEHIPFGLGEVDFSSVLDALGSAAANLPWWTVDFCFCPTTERDAATAVPYVQSLRDSFLSRLPIQRPNP